MKANLLFFRKSMIAINAYSTFLRENPLIMIIAYALYLSIIAHVVYAILVSVGFGIIPIVVYFQ